MQTSPSIPLHKRLTFRILLTTLIGLSLTLAAIAYTLLLSWQLEGGGAAINEAGSLRMRSYRLAAHLQTPIKANLEQELQEFNHSLSDLEFGVPKRPLFLPTSLVIRQQLKHVQSEWQQHIEKKARDLLVEKEGSNRALLLSQFQTELPQFVDEINKLVSYVEVELAEKTTWLRLCQTALIFMSLAASVALLYLLYLWIVEPVSRMQAGIARMSEDDFTVRLKVETEDEFGALTGAFNHMADHIQAAHQYLEQRVAQKTEKLQAQNHEVGTLYEIAGFLSGSHPIEPLCRGFLQRIMQHIGADGGTVRIIDSQSEYVHITVHEGLSEQMVEQEHCIKKQDCLCGAATEQGIILVRDFRLLDQAKKYRCQEEGYVSLAVFQILARDVVLGSFSLHFSKERALTSQEQRLLEILGRNLGAAIGNQRLIAKEKEIAIAEERNLLAQGLHDSIAQGLNFLNLQVQMLGDSLQRENMQEIKDILPQLRAGVKESYEDVRELLSNFRARLEDTNLESEIKNVVAKFQRQTGVHTTVNYAGNGSQLAPEQQLQVLFILQEALSNVRKHSWANQVTVKVENERDFCMNISDDGQGFSIEELSKKGEDHVGLSIMRERANRLAASLDIVSEPTKTKGTRISLYLKRQERQVA
ncbi:MAG: type IV pili methyl-accepting chemotaxis transducer N-terminal domain-containing protein [Undibacterium sp.]|nr:type IV pili methyl-accepting chemotaxis transducer N-terminal domain-containing protein [Undibacterium sp.]